MNLDHQLATIDKHLNKAEQCMEYGRLDDARVHLKIVRILREGAVKHVETPRSVTL